MRHMMTRLLLLALMIFLLAGCSTIAMERKLAEENRIDTETYGYEDEAFIYNEDVVQQLSQRFRLEELSINNVSSIMEDEIEAGHFNEVIIYMRYLMDNEEEQAAMYTDRYYEALLAHVENTPQPSQQLLADATKSARVQYELRPDDQRTTAQYATLLLYSDEDFQEGLDLLFALENQLEEQGEDFQKQTIQALAQAYLMNGQYEESVERYQTLASLDSENVLVYYNISYVLELLGRDDEAAAYLERAYAPTTDFLDTYGTETVGLFNSFFRTTTPEESE